MLQIKQTLIYYIAKIFTNSLPSFKAPSTQGPHEYWRPILNNTTSHRKILSMKYGYPTKSFFVYLREWATVIYHHFGVHQYVVFFHEF